MKRTYKQRLVAGLQAMGWVEDLTDKSKYTAFIKEGVKFANGKNRKVFVGNAGALRKGECATRSWSIGDPSTQTPMYKGVLAAGDKALGLATGAQASADCRALAIQPSALWDIFWSPEGKKILTVSAESASAAKELTPMPYSQYMGEVYVQLAAGVANQVEDGQYNGF